MHQAQRGVSSGTLVRNSEDRAQQSLPVWLHLEFFLKHEQ